MVESLFSLPTPAVVLVCDDDADTRDLVIHVLGSLPVTFIEARDGIEAQEKCAECRPDCIVIDIMMPRMTGTDFVKWFRDTPSEPYVPVLFLTALDEVDDLVAGLGVGADDYLRKPFQTPELLARVQSLLRIRALTKKLYDRKLELERTQAQLIAKERELVAMHLAGAAAHSLGQPLTSILLNCHLIEKHCTDDKSSTEVRESVSAIKKECSLIKSVLHSLNTVDPTKTEPYVGDTRILSLKPRQV